MQVNAINPGSIRTDRFRRMLETAAAQQGIDVETAERKLIESARTTRIGEPEDIAALVVFVVSPEGRFLQGALIDMDGGADEGDLSGGDVARWLSPPPPKRVGPTQIITLLRFVPQNADNGVGANVFGTGKSYRRVGPWR